MIADKLRKPTFKYIESEVFNLQDTLHEIDLMRYEIIHSTSIDLDSPQPGRNSVRNITNQTESKATALMTHKKLERLEEKSNSILKIYDGLIPEKQELIKLYYWKRPGELTWEGVAKEINIARSTAIRWRRTFIYDVAKELGER